MRRPCSGAGAATSAWMLAAFLLLALATPADALDSAGATLNSTYNIVAMPESCSYVRKHFGSPILDFQAIWTSNATVPPDCTLEISKLFLHGTCSVVSNKRWTLDTCAFKASGSDSACEWAVSNGRPSSWDTNPSWWSTVQPNAQATSIFDAGSVCDTAPFLGYFYIHNSCSMTLSFTLTVTTKPRSQCHFPANVFRMVKNVVLLLLYGFFTVLTYVYLGAGGLAAAILAVIVVVMIYWTLGAAAVWAYRSYRERRELPPTVEMTAPMQVHVSPDAGEATAKEDTPLLDGGTHVPTPSVPPAGQQ